MEKDIKDLTRDELTNPGFVKSVYENYEDEEERNKILCGVVEVAKELRVLGKVKKEIDKCNKDLRVNKRLVNGDVSALLEFDQYGNPLSNTSNYVLIMNNDSSINKRFVYDIFSNKILRVDQGEPTMWSDMDDSELRVYIEETYGVYNQQKYYDAFNKVLFERKFHPIKYLIEKEEWDGTPRIDRFLIDILKCPDDDYHREVSRMIFYGGISRLYNPGCKFDYMPILIGKQGCGKSTIIKWLALHDSYATDITSIDGKDALEQLQGSWMCEFAELLAMVRTKEVEAMKGFITRTSDKFRQSYGRRTNEYLRQCIFIGTTNDYNFLVDKTGNRRYLPVEIGLTQTELFDKEQYVKTYIMFCWREALYLFNDGLTYLTIPSKYQKQMEKAQESVMEDDPKTGLIEAYIMDKKPGELVCGLEIFTKCLHNIRRNYNRAEANEISRFMSYRKDWVRCKKSVRFPEYGVQGCWEKIETLGDDLD